MDPREIADLIDRVMTGEPWHGPSVAQVLEGIAAPVAARPGPGGTHSIWELVLHMTGWAREVTARLGGRPAQDPDEGDWPVVSDTSPDRWRDDRAALFAAHEALARALRRLDGSVLPTPVADFRHDERGIGLSHALTLHGLVHHTVYHAGQIALLKRAQQAG